MGLYNQTNHALYVLLCPHQYKARADKCCIEHPVIKVCYNAGESCYSRHVITMTPVCNDHLYDKIYYLLFI